jgi:hypothetical protein
MLLTDEITSPSLAGNPLGDSATRKMTIYLPPSYGDGRNYPVVYLLHGYGGDERHFVTRNSSWKDFPAGGFAGPEARHFCRLDFDHAPGLRIAAAACGTFAHHKGAEADQSHRLAAFQFGRYRGNGGIERPSGRGLGQIGGRGDIVDQVVLIHVFLLDGMIGP